MKDILKEEIKQFLLENPDFMHLLNELGPSAGPGHYRSAKDVGRAVRELEKRKKQRRKNKSIGDWVYRKLPHSIKQW